MAILIRDKVQNIADAKAAIKAAIRQQGVAVDDTLPFAGYASKVLEISGPAPTKTLPPQSQLTAACTAANTVTLSWTRVECHGYLIIEKRGAAPASTADGTIVYDALETGAPVQAVLDGKIDGATYYYRIFPYNSDRQYQAEENGSIASCTITSAATKTVADLQLGDVVKFGQYGSSLLEWEVIDTLDKWQGFVTVACKQNTGNKQFDAPENASANPNPVTNRKNNGNNRWGVSNLRQWLNSTAEAGAWWSATHEYDVKPNYANEAGFLSKFTEYELTQAIMPKENKCILDEADGGGFETVEDIVWLPSSYAVGLEIWSVIEDDHIYEGMRSNAGRSYQSNWWLRTISGSNSASYVRYVSSSGALLNYGASNSYVAGRPFCLLRTSTSLTTLPSADGSVVNAFASDSLRNP